MKHLFLLSHLLLLCSTLCRAQEPVYTPPSFEVFMKGRYVFERNCILCHGERGDGNGEMAKDLKPRPRSFREGYFKFRTTPWDKMPTDDDLRRTLNGGLTGTAMGIFTHLPQEDIEAVIAYVKSFSRRWKKPEHRAPPMTFPPVPDWFENKAERAKHAETGKTLFLATCATCHGEKGDGKGPTAPTLKDVWGLSASPSDLRQEHLRCGDGPADVYRVLSTGLNGTPMLSFDQTLTPEQRWDIIAYIQTIQVPSLPLLNPSSPPKPKSTP